ncbi:MAG: LapA family protein [Lysobacter sp.]|nr:LapA family protein [Lysobacter sp.]
MQALAWIFRFAIVLVLIWFAVKNSQVVTLHGFPEQSWQAPLVFVVLVAFVAGVVIGLLAWLPTVVRQRRENAKLRKSVAAAIPVTPPIVTPPEPGPAVPRPPLPPPDAHGV